MVCQIIPTIKKKNNKKMSQQKISRTFSSDIGVRFFLENKKSKKL